VKCYRLMFCLCLTVALIGCTNNDPRVERTSGANRAEMESLLNNHLISLTRNSNGVSFASDGRVGIRDSAGTWQKAFVLGQGEKFMEEPDHHMSATFEVVNVKAGSVVLKYVSTFDRRSFGKNLITVDEGEIEIPYKSNM